MRGYSGWNYAPYRPFMTEVGDIYICRIVPGTHSIHFEWLDIGAEKYDIFFRVREQGDFIHSGSTTSAANAHAPATAPIVFCAILFSVL